ncbi:MAG: hypothetical protein JWN04_3354 [Myxococcaceae bacterium]|nr:hypothetical protein [Myxococcaceae bacterium]
MMIAGASIFGGSYLLSMVIGAALIDNNSDTNCSDCRSVGRWLFVPIVGPFAAMADSHHGDVGLLLLGMVELVGAGLLTGGIIRYRNSKRALDAQGFSWNLEHNRKLSLNLQASERSAGPRMRLAF